MKLGVILFAFCLVDWDFVCIFANGKGYRYLL